MQAQESSLALSIHEDVKMVSIIDKSDLRVRKFVPIDREYPIYEILARDEIIFDVTKDGYGNLEIAFHVGVSNKGMRIAAFQEIIEECKTLLEEVSG